MTLPPNCPICDQARLSLLDDVPNVHVHLCQGLTGQLQLLSGCSCPGKSLLRFVPSAFLSKYFLGQNDAFSSVKLPPRCDEHVPLWDQFVKIEVIVKQA